MLESIEKDKLYTALADAQVKFPTIRVNRKAFKNEYADLYAILKPIFPILHQHGLSIRPWAGRVNGEQWIGARLMHKSGQFETNIFKFEPDPCKNPNDQPSHKKQGALTYFNRNHIKDMLGVLISDDPEDDDGQGEYHEKQPHAPTNSPQERPFTEYITYEQLEHIEHEVGSDKDLHNRIKNFYKIENLSNIPKDQFQIVADRIKSYKNTLRDNGK